MTEGTGAMRTEGTQRPVRLLRAIRPGAYQLHCDRQVSKAGPAEGPRPLASRTASARADHGPTSSQRLAESADKSAHLLQFAIGRVAGQLATSILLMFEQCGCHWSLTPRVKDPPVPTQMMDARAGKQPVAVNCSNMTRSGSGGRQETGGRRCGRVVSCLFRHDERQRH